MIGIERFDNNNILIATGEKLSDGITLKNVVIKDDDLPATILRKSIIRKVKLVTFLASLTVISLNQK